MHIESIKELGLKRGANNLALTRIAKSFNLLTKNRIFIKTCILSLPRSVHLFTSIASNYIIAQQLKKMNRHEWGHKMHAF